MEKLKLVNLFQKYLKLLLFLKQITVFYIFNTYPLKIKFKITFTNKFSNFESIKINRKC